jgi:hypothetical protein
MGGLQGSIKRILFLKGRQIQRDLRARTRSQLSPSGQSAHRPIQINLCLRQVAEKPADRTSPAPAQHAEVLFKAHSSIAHWWASVRVFSVGESADIVCAFGRGIGLFGLR